jgi:hypothetical protein
MKTPRTPLRLSVAATILVLTLGWAGLTGIKAPRAGAAPTAKAAHTVSVNDEAHLHVVKASGSVYTEEGTTTGTIPGTLTVHINIGANITSTFTIYAHSGGSISGHGKATLHSTSIYSSFGGTLTVTGGSGRYQHAHGNGGLYGTLDRRTNAVTIQTTSKLSY